jgi:hypothetical protein
MKIFNYTIGNRTRDFPTCSAVPQPTALPRALYVCKEHKLKWVFNKLDTDWFDNNVLGQHGNKPLGSVKLVNILTGWRSHFK